MFSLLPLKEKREESLSEHRWCNFRLNNTILH
jgi:hypothetical protein